METQNLYIQYSLTHAFHSLASQGLTVIKQLVLFHAYTYLWPSPVLQLHCQVHLEYFGPEDKQNHNTQHRETESKVHAHLYIFSNHRLNVFQGN